MRAEQPFSATTPRPPLVAGPVIALAWLLFSGFMVLLIFGQNLSAGTPTDWREALGGRLLHGLIWGLLTPVVFALAARFDLTERRRWLPKLLAHAAASYGLTLTYRLVYAGAMDAVGALPGGFSLASVVANANNWVPIYWMLLCIAYAVQYRERFREGQLRAAQLETQLVQAQLQALKMQLQPHFLFNSLNAVSALMSADVKAARRMLAQLSQFLRLVLDGADAHEVTLAQELHLTRLYLEIEQTRFPDRPCCCSRWWRTPCATAWPRRRARASWPSAPGSRVGGCWCKCRTTAGAPPTPPPAASACATSKAAWPPAMAPTTP
jgi:two-component system LytT family sensor kinase